MGNIVQKPAGAIDEHVTTPRDMYDPIYDLMSKQLVDANTVHDTSEFYQACAYNRLNQVEEYLSTVQVEMKVNDIRRRSSVGIPNRPDTSAVTEDPINFFEANDMGTALHTAILHRNYDIVKLLIEHHAVPNRCSTDRTTEKQIRLRQTFEITCKWYPEGKRAYRSTSMTREELNDYVVGMNVMSKIFLYASVNYKDEEYLACLSDKLGPSTSSVVFEYEIRQNRTGLFVKKQNIYEKNSDDNHEYVLILPLTKFFVSSIKTLIRKQQQPVNYPDDSDNADSRLSGPTGVRRILKIRLIEQK
ncbi:unnamed protein product [Didymodactylos carnosus]|uniref:Uncharacterized protein n=1 Tax=Didymodactylos carnosus TaxID=1234261 RepID=A0A8S2DLY6_9BILA|nr:unnamed protein product [Didymodactylos carnosus]CAF3747015.1 unnamed protein product [Didymodactylos carnosus]